jgi:hypothetical protein|tara:strand:+ start:990 stop:1136 length:147 start_codon:yes stop_codon:yes gene_type:complete
MNIIYTIFFFGLAMSLVVLKGILMSREFAVKSRQERMGQSQKQRDESN